MVSVRKLNEIKFNSLKRAFQFDEQILTANKRGELTKTQQKMMKATRKRALATQIIWSIFIGGVALSIFLLSLSRGFRFNEVEWWVALLFIFIGIIVPVTFFGISAYAIYHFQKTKDNTDIVSEEGTVLTRSYRMGRARTEYYQMKINEAVFNINRDCFQALEHGQPYRVFYIESTQYILSVEPLY